jgi:hypothetical protein
VTCSIDQLRVPVGTPGAHARRPRKATLAARPHPGIELAEGLTRMRYLGSAEEPLADPLTDRGLLHCPRWVS